MEYREMETKTLYQLKTQYYGETGTPKRDKLERELESLRILLKDKCADRAL